VNILSAVGFIIVPVAVVVLGVVLKARVNTSKVLRNTAVQLHLPDAERSRDRDQEMQHSH
jgi:hypothetical protein